MPGGEGSDTPFNLHPCVNANANVNVNQNDNATDHNEGRLHTDSDSVRNDSLCADDNYGDNSMTIGDGVRRRKVIRAAKETLDKGKTFCLFSI